MEIYIRLSSSISNFFEIENIFTILIFLDFECQVETSSPSKLTLRECLGASHSPAGFIRNVNLVYPWNWL